MNLKLGFVRSLIVSVGMAFFLVFIVQPKNDLNLGYELLGLTLIQLVAFYVANMLTSGDLKQLFIVALIDAAAFSLIIELFLSPTLNLGFDVNLLIIFAVEVTAIGLAELLIYYY